MSKKILLVDDSNTIRKSGKMFLEQAGYSVVLAEDGFSGVERAALDIPDLIFIDVMMPNIDGYTACAAIKKNPVLRHIPVVMLTSKDTLLDRARGSLVGADLYLIKPFNKKSLIEAVESLI